MNPTILIIEDEPELLELLKTLLRSVGYRTLTAENWREGVRLARTETPDLLVLDGHLPGLNELLSKLARHPGLTPERTLFLVVDETDLRTDPIPESELRFLQKPFASGALLRRIRDSLDEDGTPVD
jgi:DNA-binding response OmpR family regulator